MHKNELLNFNGRKKKFISFSQETIYYTEKPTSPTVFIIEGEINCIMFWKNVFIHCQSEFFELFNFFFLYLI